MRRFNLRQLLGKKPEQKWKKETRKLIGGLGKGVDWWRYQQTVLQPLMFPFAKECLKKRPGTIVQGDKAPAHNHYIQQRVYDLYQVRRLLWCGNSLDLNAIEPCWPQIKRVATKKGALKIDVMLFRLVSGLGMSSYKQKFKFGSSGFQSIQKKSSNFVEGMSIKRVEDRSIVICMWRCSVAFYPCLFSG